MSEQPGTPEETLPPYIIEGARSGRARCKTCRRTIAKGALRLGILIEGPYGTGYLWHHLKCAARRQFDRVEQAYANEAWRNAKDPPTGLPDLEELRRHAERAEERRRTRKPPPYFEVDPSGRARCKQCGRGIKKGSLRIVLGKRVQFGSQVRTATIHVHPECVAESMSAEDSATEAEGFAEALREHSDPLPVDRWNDLLDRIGPLS